MLKVRVIKKFHDAKGILIGYTIQDETGATRNVYKDQLKQAVAAGQVEVVNMTLTSDGRFIGKAAPAPKKKAPAVQLTGCKLVEIYTNGKNISGALVNQIDNYKMQGITPVELKGVPLGFGFEPGTDVNSRIENGTYDNVKIVMSKIDLGDAKKKSFKSVKAKLLKILDGNNISTTLSVSKGDDKYEYRVSIDAYDAIDNDAAIQIILCLIEDAMITNKIKPLYIDEDSVFVSCMTGIADVRKAAKGALKADK